MQTLSKTQFNNYLNSLDIIGSCDVFTAHDELGDVCTINPIKSTCDFNDAFIDGVEFLLTENQKIQIARLIDNHVEANLIY